MSQIINQLATIKINDEMLQQFDVAANNKSFTDLFRRLDDLKNVRSEHSKKNFIMRWWDSNKLREAELDAVDVQAEFSKRIGQMMVIIIMQSKHLTEQQTKLNEQQGKLKSQGDVIAEQTATLQKQHHTLAEQSAKLENLVCEHIVLKGLTEEGTQKLIEIAHEMKATKDGMLQEFEIRFKNKEAVWDEMQTIHMEAIFAQVDKRLRLSAENIQTKIVAVQNETREALTAYQASQRVHQEVAHNALNQDMARLAQSHREAETLLQSKHSALESLLSKLSQKHDRQFAAHEEKLGAIEGTVEGLSVRSSDLATALAGVKTGLATNIVQQQTHHDALATFQQEVSKRLKSLRYFKAGMLVAILGILGLMTYLMK